MQAGALAAAGDFTKISYESRQNRSGLRTKGEEGRRTRLAPIRHNLLNSFDWRQLRQDVITLMARLLTEETPIERLGSSPRPFYDCVPSPRCSTVVAQFFSSKVISARIRAL